ncbi:hypothetical protein [Vreelandella alkaliphila]|uniref:PgaA membrane beta barrel domain-containing protein n=1 Tax=Vreelandella alkaliphila TaxID=272774 RepID=A0A7C9P0B1_9GAMM|nr:hypothetical protein [Halomonas alkaliphila]NDL69393.1 hypothetical protein [Halomonas alkaliphila]
MANNTPHLEELFDQAVAERREHQWLSALALYERALRIDPTNDTAYRERTITLSLQGSAGLAWHYYQRRPDLFNADEASGFEQDYIARLAVWGTLPNLTSQSSKDDMQRALMAQDTFLAQQEGEVPLRQRFDNIYILNGMQRHEEVVAIFRQLEAEDIELPPYVMRIIGDSLLSTKKPQEAAALMEQVAESGAAVANDHIIRAYAYLESGRWREAIELLEVEAEQQRAWLWEDNAQQPHSNWNRYFLDATLAMVRGYTGDQPGAQEALEAMAKIDPRNAGLQANLGSVYLQRGWDEQALTRFQVATHLDPRLVDGWIGQVDALANQQRLGDAREAMAQAVLLAPDSSRVEKMQQNWQTRTGWQVSASAYAGRSEAPNDADSPAGFDEQHHQFSAWSPVLDDRWRLGILGSEHFSEFRGERVHDTRGGVGLRYAYDRLSLETRLERSVDDFARNTSVMAELSWRVNETVDARARYATHSRDGSLQARSSGITADQALVGLSWSPNERHSYQASITQLDYSDGNHRESLSLNGWQRVIDNPDHALGLNAGLYAGQASDLDVPYYNPEASASWELGALWEVRNWRHYEHSFIQDVGASVGQSWQQEFGTRWIPSLSYHHRWAVGNGRDLKYGLSWSRPVYDGNRETQLSFDIGITWGE